MFIQVIEGQVSDPDRLRKQMEQWETDIAPSAEGWLGYTAGVTDEGEHIAVVRFESEEAARRNSERSEQGEWWAETEQLFEGEATFRDYPNVDLWLDGGSDDAGFVQVIQGRQRGERSPGEMLEDFDDLSTMRPEIIGGSIAWDEDGHFTETVYFTSEDAARQGEQRMAEDADASRQMEEWMSQVDDVRYLDLRDPWLASA